MTTIPAGTTKIDFTVPKNSILSALEKAQALSLASKAQARSKIQELVKMLRTADAMLDDRPHDVPDAPGGPGGYTATEFKLQEMVTALLPGAQASRRTLDTLLSSEEYACIRCTKYAEMLMEYAEEVGVFDAESVSGDNITIRNIATARVLLYSDQFRTFLSEAITKLECTGGPLVGTMSMPGPYCLMLNFFGQGDKTRLSLCVVHYQTLASMELFQLARDVVSTAPGRLWVCISQPTPNAYASQYTRFQLVLGPGHTPTDLCGVSLLPVASVLVARATQLVSSLSLATRTDPVPALCTACREPMSTQEPFMCKRDMHVYCCQSHRDDDPHMNCAPLPGDFPISVKELDTLFERSYASRRVYRKGRNKKKKKKDRNRRNKEQPPNKTELGTESEV
jgi:hypothetical protein